MDLTQRADQGSRSVTALALLLLALTVPAGCRTKTLFKVPSGNYRVEKTAENSAIMLAPPMPVRYRTDQPIKVALTIPGRYKLAGTTSCAIREGAFALSPAKDAGRNTLALRLPALNQWQAALSATLDAKVSEQLRASLNRFIDGVDLLAKNGCLPAGIAEPIRALVLQTIPLSPQQALYNFYEYWRGYGAVDLEPNLRLKIQRAYFAKPNRTQDGSIKQYLGTTTIYYEIQQSGRGSLTLRKGKLDNEPISSNLRLEANASDMSLDKTLPRTPVHRLVFFSNFVSQQIERPALILSAATYKALDTATVHLQSDPARSCLRIEQEDNVRCTPFSGDVTVSPEIRIFVNGHSRYVPFGTTLADVRKNEKRDTNESFRLTRLFHDAYSTVDLPIHSQAAIPLTLVGGDKLVWR